MGVTTNRLWIVLTALRLLTFQVCNCDQVRRGTILTTATMQSPVTESCIYIQKAGLTASYKNVRITEPRTSFFEGDQLKFRCSDITKYKFQGSKNRTCISGAWSNDEPKCTELRLRDPDSAPVITFELSGGDLLVSSYGVLHVTTGAYLTFHCNWFQDFGQPKWSAEGPRVAAANPTWNYKKDTFNLKLFDLQEKHSGRYSCTNPEGKAHSIKLKVQQYLGEEPDSVPFIECLQPTIPDNSIVLDSSCKCPFGPGSNLVFRCKHGFVMVGESTMTCDGEGTWNKKPPKCVKAEETCISPGPLLNGKIKVSDLPEVGRVHLMGTTLQFSCDLLHFLSGSTEATCQGNGTWSNPLPSCIKVTTCPALDSIPNVVTQTFKPNRVARSVRILRRPSIASNTTRRTRRGVRFRTNFRSQVVPQPSHQEAVLKIDLPEGFYHVGTKATFVCESKYYDLYGSSTRTCLANGKWSGRPTVCVPVCGKAGDPRTFAVVGGTPSKKGQWPWIVLIRLLTTGALDLHCGGSLIDESWVITAAHCVTERYTETVLPVNILQFHFGKYFSGDTLDDAEVQTRQAEVIHVHPDYNASSLKSDIALVRLSQPVRLTSRIQPVCLPSSDQSKSQERLREGNHGVAIGWGAKENGLFSDVLLHVHIPFVSTNTCVQGYSEAGHNIGSFVTSDMFCAGYEEGKHNICSGDSGGPLVFPADSSRTKYILDGITSWRSEYGCGLKKQYSGYVRVQSFVDWIHTFG